MIEKTKNFVFKALLLNNELESLSDIGGITLQSPAMGESEKARSVVSIDDFSSRIRLDAIKMASVYMAFFAFENSVRDLVKERLAERAGLEWWSKCMPKKIKDSVQIRKNKDAKNKWHAPRAKDDISYTDFGDLSDIIITRWDYFEDLFPSQEWIKTRLSDLEQSRNTIAHNNILSERDIERIKMYLQDWLSQVG